MSNSSLATEGLLWPLPTISKACRSGTPAFIMVASWRVNNEISLAVILLPPRPDAFLTLGLEMPWRRNVAPTMASPEARISPLTTFPVLSLPSHRKVYILTSLELFLIAAAGVDMADPLFVGDGFDFLERSQTRLYLAQT